MSKAKDVLTNLDTQDEGRGYDLQKIGGGIDNIYVDIKKDGVEVIVGMYSGGAKVPFKFPKGPKLKAVEKEKDSDMRWARQQEVAAEINDAVMNAVVKELKAFEKKTEKAIMAAISKVG